MIAGRGDALDDVRPVLQALGSKIFQIGERPGAAQALKLASQVMLAANMLGVFEGMNLATSYGLVAEQVLPVVAASRGSSWVSENRHDVLRFWRDYRPGEALHLVHKDLDSALAAASARRIPMPAAALAVQLLQSSSGSLSQRTT